MGQPCLMAPPLTPTPPPTNHPNRPPRPRWPEGHDMALVFEDDFQLLDQGGDFMRRLRRAMEQLPEDWEVGAARDRRPEQQLSPALL